MRTLERRFRELEKRGEAALVAYVTGGDPKPEHTVKIIGALMDGGADIVEVGIPFSDPIADGPTIQGAVVRALTAQTAPNTVLEMVRDVKTVSNIPIVILTYYNPVFKIGVERFLSQAERCRVDGVIIPDLPLEEAGEYEKAAEAHDIDTIFLASPSTSIDRLKKIIDHTSGFLYLVSHFGVTGAKVKLEEETIRLVKRFLPYSKGRIPMAVGFGISRPEHVKAVVEAGAQGAIVGSAFVDIISQNLDDIGRMLKQIEGKARELKKGTIVEY